MARKTRNEKLLQRKREENASKTYQAGIYARLSLESGKEKGDSISNQISICKEYLRTTPDIKLVNVYSDNGYTGTSFHRPAWNQMMKAIENREINVIIVRDFSRFGRDYIEAGKYLEKIFPALGVRFISVNDHFDSLYAEEAEVSLTIQFHNIVNTLYSRDISRKIISSIDSRQSNQLFHGSNLPYGYIWNDTRTAYAIDEAAATQVRQIFDWKRNGLSIAQIVRNLNEAGMEAPEAYKIRNGLRKGSPRTKLWGESTVYQLLQNSAYVGEIVHGKKRRILYQGISCRKQPPSDWIIYKNMHPAIITQETFDEVQKRLQKAAKEAKHKKEESKQIREAIVNLFIGKIYCGECGMELCFRRCRVHKAVTERWSGYYNCKGHENKKPHTCNSHRIDREKLHDIVFLAIQMKIRLTQPREKMNRIMECFFTLSQDIIDAYIQRVMVYEDRRIEIVFTHKDITCSMLSTASCLEE